jgi:hypothetical protein
MHAWQPLRFPLDVRPSPDDSITTTWCADRSATRASTRRCNPAAPSSVSAPRASHAGTTPTRSAAATVARRRV